MELKTKIWRLQTEDRIRSPLTDVDFLALVTEDFKKQFGIVCGPHPSIKGQLTYIGVHHLLPGSDINLKQVMFGHQFDMNRAMKFAARCIVVRKTTKDEVPDNFTWIVELHRDGRLLGGLRLNLTDRRVVLAVLVEFLLKNIAPGEEAQQALQAEKEAQTQEALERMAAALPDDLRQSEERLVALQPSGEEKIATSL